MDVGAHDVRNTFPSSSTAATAAMCRTGGRTRSRRHAEKRRRRALKNGFTRVSECRRSSQESSLSHEFQSPEEYSMSQFAHFSLSIFIVTQPSWARSRSGTIELIFTGSVTAGDVRY